METYHNFFFRPAHDRGVCSIQMRQRIVFVNLQVDHEAQNVRPQKFHAADEENAMESRDEHEVEKLRRRPQNGTVHVRREELGLGAGDGGEGK